MTCGKLRVVLLWSLNLWISNSLLFAAQGGKAPRAQRPVAGARAAQRGAAIAINFYVSARGNDAWSGKLPNPRRADGPFASLARARDAVRQLKKQGGLTRPVTIYVRGGEYALGETLEFTPLDSGTAQCPVTYTAYRNEISVLSSDRVVTGWRRVMSMGAGSSSTGANDSGPEQSALWTADVPGVKEGKWYFRELFVNDRRAQRARTPNSGFFLVDGVITAVNPARFKYHEGDIQQSWADKGDVEVVALLKWAEFRMPIKAVDALAHIVTLSTNRQEWGDEKNPRYWIENTFDALDAPGEWYLNRHAGVLYYRANSQEDLTRARVVAPVLEQLIRIRGDTRAGESVHHVILHGLIFAHTGWSMPPPGYVDNQAAYDIPAAVEAEGARECSIEKCVFIHLGGYAVHIHHGSKSNRVAGNKMADLGAGGIKIGDPEIPDREVEATSGNVVANNRISDIGRVYPAAVGVWVGQSGGNTIAHNEISETSYTGISVGWTWGYGPTAARDNVIEFNHIHDIGRGLLSDMGCIYTLGVQPGTLERNNLCHDVIRYERGYGGWGIYTDEGSSNILIENNLVYRVQDGGFHQHYGRDNVVRNNIFALGGTAEIRRTREEPHTSFTFERNIVYWKNGPLLDGKWGDGHYRFDSNLYFRAGEQPVRFADWSFEDWRKRGEDVHSLIADPVFRNAEGGDFSLQPDSPASKVGFQPFDTHKAGPEK